MAMCQSFFKYIYYCGRAWRCAVTSAENLARLGTLWVAQDKSIKSRGD